MPAGMGHHNSVSRFGKRKEGGITPTMGYTSPIKSQLFPDDVWISVEPATPKTVANQDRIWAVEGLLVRRKFPARSGHHAQTWKNRGETQARVTFSGRAPVESETSSV